MPTPCWVPAFVVTGGGPDGVYGIRQLRRAMAAGRIATLFKTGTFGRSVTPP